eukprot:COSAG02_NODE_2000_length_10140_cov_14.090429_2_plen_191_part_00
MQSCILLVRSTVVGNDKTPEKNRLSGSTVWFRSLWHLRFSGRVGVLRFRVVSGAYFHFKVIFRSLCRSWDPTPRTTTRVPLVHCGGERPRVARGRGHGCVTCVAPRQTRNMCPGVGVPRLAMPNLTLEIGVRRVRSLGPGVPRLKTLAPPCRVKSRSLCQSLSRLEDRELILCIARCRPAPGPGPMPGVT